MLPTGRPVYGVTSVSSSSTLGKKAIAVSASTNGPTQPTRMHTDPTLTKCTNCGRTGVMRENGIPAAWRREHQDQLLCPVCWGPDDPPPFDPLAERKMVPSVWADA